MAGQLSKFLILAVCVLCPPVNAQNENHQIVELYCEGTDYASHNPKHILVSIDRTNRLISITDPLREAPRVLTLVEDEALYRANGNHISGFQYTENERIHTVETEDRYCEQGQKCKAYLIYTVDFSLNRQSGRFEYLLSGEIREEKSNALLRKVDDWGIFQNTRCIPYKKNF